VIVGDGSFVLVPVTDGCRVTSCNVGVALIPTSVTAMGVQPVFKRKIIGIHNNPLKRIFAFIISTPVLHTYFYYP
jgi:hypothetical protein